MIFRTREILVMQRTQLINSLRGLLEEFGVIAPTGRANIEKLCEQVHEPDSPPSDNAVEVGQVMLEQINLCQDKIEHVEKKTLQAAKTDEEARRVMTIPGVGSITAMALQAFAPDMARFENGRHFAAWLGPVPKQKSTSGNSILGSTSKMGQRDIRRLLISGAMALLSDRARNGAAEGSWIARMLASKPKKLIAVTLANKMARMIWAVTTKRQEYRTPNLTAQTV